jgi:uncharacterized membrane protein HdeD (DUF308 family)
MATIPAPGDARNTPPAGSAGPDNAMQQLLSRCWWALALRGALALLLGLLALIWPGATLLTLVALFAAYALIGGGVTLVGALQNRRSDRGWWMMLALGIVSVVAGVIALVQPGLTALLLVLLMGFNALFGGAFEIAAAIRLRRRIEHEWLLGLTGLASVVFGLLVLVYPGAGALALVWMISLYATTIGVLLLVLAMRARRWPRQTEGGGSGAPPQPPR